MQLKVYLASILLISVFLGSCTPHEKGSRNQVFGDTLELRYAKGFQVIQYEHYTSIVILDPANNEILQEIELADEKFSPSTLTLNDKSRLACLSTTHVSMLTALGSLNQLCAVAFGGRIQDEAVKSKIDAGTITDIGGEAEVDLELLTQSQPDVFFIYPYDTGDLQKYQESGIPCIQVAEYLETHPLGRAEWLKLFGIVLGKEHLADSLFNAIEERYNEAKMTAALSSSIPSVFTGSNYHGMWYAPSGESFIAEFLRDASSVYVFDDSRGNDNLQIDMEEMIERAHHADFWGKVVFADSLESASSLAESDERLLGFKAFQEGNLFVCNASSSDYFGRGVIEPDEILKDLIHIFHPSIYPNREGKYFQIWLKN